MSEGIVYGPGDKKPLYEPEREASIWFKHQIYTGSDGTGVIVPNVGDAVFSWENGFERVIDVETANKTYISTLGPGYDLPNSGVGNRDVLLANAGGHITESYNLYMNTQVSPVSINFDARLYFPSSDVSYVKVFLGTDTSQSGQVISAQYDNSGSYVSENIPCDVVAIDGLNNIAMKSPRRGHSTRILEPNELVTAVAYNNAHEAISFARLLTRDASFVRRLTTQSRVVTGVRLSSQWVSKDNPDTLIIPANVPVSDIRVKAIVSYNTSEERAVDIDGTRATLGGLEDFVSMSPGQKKPLTLTYYLEESEEAITGGQGLKRHFSVPCYAQSAEADGAYSLKLFACPTWMGDLEGYKLRFFLYNLDGTLTEEVTGEVEIEADTGSYIPTRYNYAQGITASLPIRRIDPNGGSFIHVQKFVVTLLSPATVSGDDYLLDYGNGSGFGESINPQPIDNSDGTYSVNLRSGAISADEWIRRHHDALDPLHGLHSNAEERKPTHFEILYRGEVARYKIEDYFATPCPLPVAAPPQPGEAFEIRCVRELQAQYQYLSTVTLHFA